MSTRFSGLRGLTAKESLPDLVRPARQLQALNVLGRRTMALGLIMGILVIGFESVGVAMLLPLLEFVQNGGEIGALAVKSRLWQVIADVHAWVGLQVSLPSLSAAVLVLVSMRQLTSFFDTLYTVRVKQGIEKKLMDRLFAAFFAARGGHIQSVGTARFVELMYGQCPGAAGVARTYGNMWRNLISFLFYGGILFVSSPQVSIGGLVLIALVVLSLNRYVKVARNLTRNKIKLLQEFSVFLTERYRGWRLIKLSVMEQAETARTGRWTRQVFDVNNKVALNTGIISLVVTPVVTAFALVALWAAVTFAKIDVATMTMFFVVILRLMPVAEQFARLRQSLVAQAASLERVCEGLAQARAAREAQTGTCEFGGLTRAIELNDVRVVYNDDGEAVLKGVSCRIPANAMTAIIGPSGAGKSTLIDLLPRLLEPVAGEVCIDGVDVRNFTLPSLRSRIAYPAQQPVLFEGSVAENVAYGRPDATREEIEEACRQASADQFIRALPQGYDTLLGEGGSGLSGGERQRLALARAFIAKADILILDEPTSALDLETERSIQTAIADLRARRTSTIIVIAHRLSTIRDADHLIILKNGQVIEEGKPSELRHAETWYAQMLELNRSTLTPTGDISQ